MEKLGLRKDKSTQRAFFSKVIVSTAIALMALVALFSAEFVYAAGGTLDVQLADPDTGQAFNAYNLVVDSNVTAPSTYAPSVATVIVRFCNTSSSNTLEDVWGYIGDYQGSPSASTPGIYPARTVNAAFIAQHPDLTNPGSYAFTHVGGNLGTQDARRYIGTLQPGECRVQYWHFTYPQCENSPAWGDSVKPEDDLWLDFDVWGTAEGQVDDETWRMTMRNEISAMANKIEPNPDGIWFNTNSSVIAPGDVITSNGVLYRFGNANQGFDNDGDFIPDYNAWAQPIGDAAYDPSCFRLIRTTGVLTISRSAMPDMIVDVRVFTDKLYFMNLPPDNTNIEGQIHYVFQALGGPCTTAMTPYQEVASGSDNEKFNADFGTGIPPLESTAPQVSVDKQGNVTVVPGARIYYTVTVDNAGSADAGLPLFSMPIAVSDTAPVSTTFTGDFGASGFTVLYSTDDGETYTTTAPSPPSLITNVDLRMNDTLTASTAVSFTFSVTVSNAANVPPIIENCADVGFDGAAPFDQDCTTTLVLGNNAIGDTVWRDEDRDREQDAGESGLDAITVDLYYDKDGNGEYDPSVDIFFGTTSTNASGYYTFTELPDGDYLVIVDTNDPQIPYGYRITNDRIHVVSDLGIATGANPDYYELADFGFGPTLSLKKTLLEGGGYEDQEIQYILSISNLRPGGGQPLSASSCRYVVWSSELDPDHTETAANKLFLNESLALGEPDGLYAIAPLDNAGEQMGVRGFYFDPQVGDITTVTMIIYADDLVALQNAGDSIDANVYITDDASMAATFTYNRAALEANTTGYFLEDITANHPAGASGWAWTDFGTNIIDVELIGDKGAGGTGNIGVDAVGFYVDTSSACVDANPYDVMSTVPLTDTFDTTYLQFVSASPPETSVNTATGVITWANVGPVLPGQTKNVLVTFLGLDPVPTPITETINNSACVTGATFSDALPANDDCDTATGLITATGTISGVVWSDLGTIGWVDPVGYVSGTDLFIAGVTLDLYYCDGGPEDTPNSDCEAQGGTWVLYDTTTTDINGHYQFVGLQEGFYYVSVDSSTILGTATPTADPDLGNHDTYGCTDGNDCSSNDETWNVYDAELQYWGEVLGFDAGETEHITNINFGYQVDAAIYGTVWEDHDRDGNRDGGDDGLDNPLGGITVTLTNSSGTVVSTTTTDANGFYSFTGITTAGTYTVTVLTSSLPPTGTWSLTSEPDRNCVSSPGAACDSAYPVTVALGEIKGSYDFGYGRTGTVGIGDTVYYDWDGDGTQDNSPGVLVEGGIPGVTVHLYEDSNGNGTIDSDDAIISTTVTADGSGSDPLGYYTFTNLYQATYIVLVDYTTLPFGLVQTGDPDEGGTCYYCNNRGSADATSGSIDTMDFGYQPQGTGAIGDTVWKDVNGDQQQLGPSETGLENITVQLEVDIDGDGIYDILATMETGASGYYTFTNLPYADYRVTVDTADTNLPIDAFGKLYVPSTPTSIEVTLTSSQKYYEDADFGFMALPAIGDTIYWDANRNGEQDWNEVGIPGVVVTLTNASVITTTDGTRYNPGTYITTTTTNANGIYSFTNVPIGDFSGTYVVTVGAITGDPTLTGDPDTNGIPCYPDPGAPWTAYCDGETTVTVNPGVNMWGADFGYIPPGVIGDFVWRDVDRDGIQDPSEPGIPGVVITATYGATTITTTTDLDGHYTFQNLSDGSWTVTFQQPPDMAPTTVSSTAIISGVGSVGTSATVVLGGGVVTSINGNACTDCDLHVDSGFVTNGSLYIAGTVFFDVFGAGDGTSEGYESGEGDSPYANITLFLWDQDKNLIGVTTTDASGNYTFTQLTGNTVYTVSLDVASPQLAGMSLTAVNGYELQNYHTVPVVASNVGGVDFGLYAPIDFGDLPDTYNTTIAAEGAGHFTSTLFLGADVDTEGDGSPSPTATNDNLDDGVVIDPTEGWIPGATVDVTVTVTGDNGYLVAFFDWNNDGDFADSGEAVIFGDIVEGTTVLTLDIPGTATFTNLLNARFRLYDKDQISYIAPTGLATGGEVEDYQWDLTPTAITLASFEATPQDEAILVTWETAMELDNVGFNLYRSTAAAGPYMRLNAALIPPQFPGEAMGGYYEWLDTDVLPDVTYYYKLEDIDVKGVSTFHGPISTVSVTAPAAVGLRSVSARGVTTLLALGLTMLLGLAVVYRQRRLRSR